MTAIQPTPADRIRALNDAPVRPERGYVLYWMTAARRARWSFALQRAVERARELARPLVVFEALRVGYPWASDRLHRFVVDGMAANARAFAKRQVGYLAYVEPAAGEGHGLLEALAADACVVVGDDYPAFFLPRMAEAAARRLDVRLEVVDGNGLLPMADADRVFPRAYGFRRHLQRRLPHHLLTFPQEDPLQGADLPAPPDVVGRLGDRWRFAHESLASGGDLDLAVDLAALPIDHQVAPVDLEGGGEAGSSRLKRFLGSLDRYADERNQPSADATSRLSPYLHFGHVGAHQVFAALVRHEGWSPARLGSKVTGSREGWWGVGPAAESFLDELVTWRELGFNMCRHDPAGYASYDALPAWAQKTLAEHAEDPRPHVYPLQQLEQARTQDPIWNAAQRQLLREGRIHGYMRMLWGKKILEWSPSPRDAAATMIALNDRWALDGRDPSSYSGIFWVLGRYDRAWGPERPIFGKIRYMTSASAARKLRLKPYLARYAA